MRDWMGNIMCPGDTDYCPHHGCTTCQGPLFYYPDPDKGAGRIDERDHAAWARFIEDYNTYRRKGNGHYLPSPAPGCYCYACYLAKQEEEENADRRG